MKKRIRKASYLEHIVLDKATNRTSIYTTIAVMCRDIGVNRSTLYRNIDDNGVFENDQFTIWCNVSVYLCNKGRDL